MYKTSNFEILREPKNKHLLASSPIVMFTPIISYGYIYERLFSITEVYNSRCSFVRYIFVFSKNNLIIFKNTNIDKTNIYKCAKQTNIYKCSSKSTGNYKVENYVSHLIHGQQRNYTLRREV